MKVWCDPLTSDLGPGNISGNKPGQVIEDGGCSPVLVEKFDFPVGAAHPLAIEAKLAHAAKDANGRAYNRTQYLKQRTVLLQ
ncbi:hypothetical protein [Variovorax arabinosiphilus]|uniref:hypothetical protein n=1 Tax=Variovorax arabinosiphilus TaxID=3053498 RepID=UPI0025771654|nr:MULTISPECIES: hypothetical protein [unclassified Variovorax]MDM0120075.1 hypothetical protein [Variovorax sp. J2L1-78]MDM0128012.1 hypothetical protein [Variovorax sp. J2L1-63]MDM0231712.1 hypothetical protein [Variovorax sp. J2R1-6]